MTKNQVFSNFESYAIFVKISTDFVDWIVEKGQQGKSFVDQ